MRSSTCLSLGVMEEAAPCVHSVGEGGAVANRGERRSARLGRVGVDRVSVSDGWLGVHEGASPTGRPPPGAGRV